VIDHNLQNIINYTIDNEDIDQLREFYGNVPYRANRNGETPFDMLVSEGHGNFSKEVYDFLSESETVIEQNVLYDIFKWSNQIPLWRCQDIISNVFKMK